MRVPGDPGPQVDLNQLPGVRYQSTYVESPNPLAPLGKAAAIMAEANKEASLMRVADTENQLRAVQSGLYDEASQKKGADVLAKNGNTFTGDYLKRWDDEVEKASANLSNDFQREVFQKRAGVMRLSLDNALKSHEAKETGSYYDSVDTNTVALEAQNAAKNVGNNGEIALGQIRINGALNSLAKRNGWSPEETAVERTKALTMFHGSVLGGALEQNQVGYAKAYLDQHASEMDPGSVDKARKIINARGVTSLVNPVVDTIWADPNLTYSEKAHALREQFKDDPDAQKAAILELEQRLQEHKVSQAEAVGNVMDMLTGLNKNVPRQSFLQVQNSPAWANLDGEQRRIVREQFDAYNRSLNAKESPADIIAKYATYMRFIENPNVLMGMSNGQITSLTGTLGVELTKKLLDHKVEISRDFNKLREASIDSTQFKDLAREYGLKVDGKLTTDDQAVLGSLRDQTRDAIAMEQTATGKTISQDRKEQIVRGLLQQVPTRKPGGPLESALGPSKYAFQIEGAYEIGATDEEKSMAYDYLVKNGAPATTANMWQMIQMIRGNR